MKRMTTRVRGMLKARRQTTKQKPAARAGREGRSPEAEVVALNVV